MKMLRIGKLLISFLSGEYGYPRLLCLLAGHTIEEVKAFAKEAINYEPGNELCKQTWPSPAGFPTSAGAISYSCKTGLRAFPEIQNMISTFKCCGIEVFIVSANYNPVVEVFTGIENGGYDVPSDHVITKELAMSVDGKILPQYKAGWIITQRQGKADAINRVIKQAVDESNPATPSYILQGRNENTGIVMPCSESILLGKAELQLPY